jgi:ubiquitin carboxyl-terminal hydrolase 4/11/15
MNSSIACLSNCTELTTYFLTGKFKTEINKKNKLGVGGKLANAWYDLLSEYWNTKRTSGNPSTIKSVVSKKAKKFSGYSQQDSNEFMTEFLSILNEDLNKSSKKEYKELKEKGKNESEMDCAKRFWNLHIERNNSIISDLFSGLLKSLVVCSKCGYNNITFDPFNTLTLAIPPYEYIKNVYKYKDIAIFYIPKYSIRVSTKLGVHALKESSFKDLPEEINKIETFKFNLKKLVYIKVLDAQLKEIIDENEYKYNPKDFIFGFDDERKEGEKSKIIPLYIWDKKKISAFPRILFLNENMSFGELKKKIYYFARKYFTSPFNNNEDVSEVDKELEQYQKIDMLKKEEEQKEEPYDENKLWSLFDKEYDEIFTENEEGKYKENIEKFFGDFPYEITIKKDFNDKRHICLFNGKNNYDNLKEYNITKDEDPITSLISNKELCLNLVINSNSNYCIESINLNSCELYKSKDYGEKLYCKLEHLLEYFCSQEYLEKGNEWKCGKCKEKVNVTKKLSIYYVPKLLIICINRFSHSEYGYSKNGTRIVFPLENLDMGEYICGPDKDNFKYDLFAVSQHYGDTGGGHYTAICKNFDNNWYSYDDSSVKKTSPDEVVTSAAYVLFYRRRTW